jgi:hypothetical protein
MNFPLATGHRALPSAYCRLPTEFERGGELAEPLGSTTVYDKMSMPTGKERTSNFKKRPNEAGMLLKTKDRCGKVGMKPVCL